MHAVEKRADDINAAHEIGTEIAVVVGAGNFVRGKEIKNISRADADHMGMSATLSNLRFLQKVLENKGLKVTRFSAIVAEGTPVYMREKVSSHLSEGKIVILGGGLGVPYHTTDYAAVIRALELDADAVLKGAKVDGIYASYPPVAKDDKPIPELSYASALNIKLEEMFDKEAVRKLVTERASIPVHVFSAFEKGNMLKVLQGENVGTVIYPELPSKQEKEKK